MGKSLVIVESPAKAKTIGKFLGSGYQVMPSVGHIRDLPEKALGVDIEHGFTPKYVLSKGKAKVVTDLKKAAKAADAIYLAPDPDREGEAIAWHLHETLKDVAKDKPFYRVQYNEITARAVKAAFEHPGEINMNRVDAQQARRVLDRIVGYKVSPILWTRVKRGLSAGRVQSVALRLVCEREKAIQAFKVEPYWVLGATVRRQTAPLDPFVVALTRVDGEKPSITSEDSAKACLSDLDGCVLNVKEVRTREIQRHPLPPFITSTLQQAASSFCSFSPNRTMGIAQKLYEGVDTGAGTVGLITYMRTDSVNIARDAREAAQTFITKNYGPQYYPETPNFYKSRESAQEAHEAIRPTDVNRTPESLKSFLDAPALKLYELIWKRFVASQMACAKIAQKSVDFLAARPKNTVAMQAGLAHNYQFGASASEVLFDGFLKVTALNIHKKKNADDEDEDTDEQDRLPPLAQGDTLDVVKWDSQRKETKPPARYSEASLIHALEENGVGRPSTYATIIETLNSREYTTHEKRQMRPTDLGMQVNDLLVSKLDPLFNVGFTAKMEESLDEVEKGLAKWNVLMDDFYKRFTGWMEQTKEPPADVGKVKTVLALLDLVSEWRPEIMRGKRKFSDSHFVLSIREQLEKGEKPISDRQLLALVRIVLAYRTQIPGAEKTLSNLGFDEVIAAVNSHASNEEANARFTIIDKIELSESQTRFVSSLRSQAESGRQLSERQLAALDRIIVQNKSQIPEFDSVKDRLHLVVTAEDMAPDNESPRLLELLSHVKEWQAPAKRGKMTFDDQAFCTSLGQQYNRQKSLSVRQRAAMKRMILRYKAQIPNFEKVAEELGLSRKNAKGEEAKEPNAKGAPQENA